MRVSIQEQNIAWQKFLIKNEVSMRFYIDKISGKSSDRPELKMMMQFVRQGITVIVKSFSRFACNTKELLEQLTGKGESSSPRKTTTHSS